MGRNASLLRFEAVEDKSRASIRVLAGEPAGRPISRFLTGKFCEHLGRNIYNGMEAQVLRNPTFADFPFGSRRRHPDGGFLLECDEEKIAEQIVRQAERLGWPQTEQLVQSRKDGLAHWWIREPEAASATVSPDVAPNGGRAQRVEVHEAGAGLAQWTHLPLHRVRKYQWRIAVRCPKKYRIGQVVFPMIDGLGPIGKDDADDLYAAPMASGRLIRRPTRDLNIGPLTYGTSASMQFSAYYDDDAGLYLAACDGAFHSKRFDCHRTPAGTLHYQISHDPAGDYRKRHAWRMPYPFVVGVFRGDWLAAAKIYRQWAVKQAWCARDWVTP